MSSSPWQCCLRRCAARCDTQCVQVGRCGRRSASCRSLRVLACSVAEPNPFPQQRGQIIHPRMQLVLHQQAPKGCRTG